MPAKCVVYENLAPSELKKLRNKQRKAKRKAEQESALQAQVQVKREQHHKARQQQEQGDPEAPQLDELIPDKLARAEDPLEQAIKFLQPLRTLAADRIDTHLMAFEIYYRKEKPLLMLQSIKRAFRLDSSHHHLHDCLLRFKCWLDDNLAGLNAAVAAVINKEIEPMGGCSINQRTSGRGAALALATSLRYADVSIAGCSDVLDALRAGDFGPCEAELEAYVAACRARFPYARAFQPAPPPEPAAPAAPADPALSAEPADN
ncbi:unnamed protein product [Chrysodeixis includens]|uniref:Uncharacterized protein n=1 Tax=Chrysodeixis includens TaxID=689277 RepID=A0A9N8PZC7_CHRIL|nr:unnamed protein product [Chrysodeixis includens]